MAMIPTFTTTGALTVIPLSGAVPTTAVYNAGEAYDPVSGALYVYPVTGAVPATAVYLAGIAHTQDGAVYVSNATPSGTIYNAGLRLTATGAIYVSGAAVASTAMPIPTWGYADANGALYINTSFFLPLNDSGAGLVDTTAFLFGGTATPTFTRATVAWTKLSTGLWTQVASGAARSCYTGADTAVGSYGGYFSELAATQLVTPDASIRDMTDASWVKGATMTAAKTGTGIDGVVNSCSRLTGGAVSATNTAFQTLTAAASSRTYSVWLRRVTGTGTINITQDGGSTYTDVTSQLTTANFVRVSLTASVLNAAFGIQVVTNGDVVLADFNQFEAGANATSPMATAGAARNVDVLTYPNTGNFSDTEGTCYAEIRPFSRIAATVQSAVTCTAATAAPLFFRGALGATMTDISISDGTGNVTSNTSTDALTAIVKAASNWGATGRIVSYQGGIGTVGAFDGSMNSVAIAIGAGTGGATPLLGTIKNVRIWQTQLSNLALQAVTG